MSLATPPSRKILEEFFNDNFDLGITKLDDLGTGAGYCKLVNALYGDLPMHNVTFNSKDRVAITTNYKILQQAFIRHKLNYNFNPQELQRCTLKENLAFSQYLYQLWHTTLRGDSETRTNEKPLSRMSSTSSGPPIRKAQSVAANIGSQPSSRHSRVESSMTVDTLFDTSYSHRKSVDGETTMRQSAIRDRQGPSRGQMNVLHGTGGVERDSRRRETEAKLAALEEKYQSLSSDLETVLDERDFYYSKLIDIEHLVNEATRNTYLKYGGPASDPTSLEASGELDFVRRLQAVLFYSPDGYEPELIDANEPF